MKDALDALIEHLKSVLEKAPGSRDQFDPRGAWRILIMMSSRMVNHCRVILAAIPDIVQDESANTRLWRTVAKRRNLPLLQEETQRMHTIVKALTLMILVSSHGDVVNSADIEQQLTSRVYIQPFWWLFDSDTARFHDMLNLLKTTVAETYQEQSFIRRLYTAATQSVSLLLSTNEQINAEVCCFKVAFPLPLTRVSQSHRAGIAAASIEYLRVLWNFAETGVPSLVVSLAKPFIKVSQNFCVPVPSQLNLPFSSVLVLVTSDNPLLFTIPESFQPDQSPDSLPNPGARFQSQKTDRTLPEPVPLDPEISLALKGDTDDVSLLGEQVDGFIVLPAEQRRHVEDVPFVNPAVSMELDPLLLDMSTPRTPESSRLSRSVSLTAAADTDAYQCVPILLHYHGGGFISGSPSTHETYLREWAKATGAVVFSVDYTKAPEKIFPHAVEECFFFYKYLVHDANAFQIRPSQFVIAGDSAGGNLALAVLFKAIQAGLRMPDALFLFYPAVDVSKYGSCATLVLVGVT